MTGFFDVSTKNFSDGFWERLVNLALITAWAFLLIFIAANIPTEQNPAVVIIFVAMFLIYLFSWTLDFIRDHFGLEEKLPMAVIGVRALLTRNPLLISVSLIVSMWAGYFLVAAKLGIVAPQSVGLEPFADFIYKAINSPIGEELAFRSMLIPFVAILIKRLTPVKNYLVALAFAIPLAAGLFAATHLLAFGAEFSLMLVSFVWGSLAGILLVLFGILAVIAFHFGNNLPLQIGKEAAFAVIFFISLIIVAIDIYIVSRIGLKDFVKGGLGLE